MIVRLVNVSYLQFRGAAQVENERKVRLKTGEHAADATEVRA